MLSADFEEDGRTVTAVARARAVVVEALVQLGLPELADDAALITSELATNAVLHGGGVVDIRVQRVDDGARISVEDRNPVAPVMPLANPDAMTGRGLLIIGSMAARWGADGTDDGKVVWVDLVPGHIPPERTEEELLDLWDDVGWDDRPVPTERHHVVLGEVPTDLLLAAKTHVDNLVREFTLSAAGAASGSTGPLPPHLAALVETVVAGFAEARDAIKRQAVEAARRGDAHVRIELSLGADAVQAAEEYLDALDAADAYSRAERLLTLETPPQHRVFRRWYIGELVRQLRAVSEGREPPPVEPFERRILRELDSAATAQRASDREARLYEVGAALSRAVTPADVAAAVLQHGVTALGASGGGLLVGGEPGHLQVPGTVGYDDAVVARLRAESPDAELPAATALRTGEPVWLESRQERDDRFPQLIGLEAGTVALCAVPLVLGDRRLGALRFSFQSARLFDDAERRFVLALASQTAQALDRAQMHERGLDQSRRLQRSLLPGRTPVIPGIEVATVYHPMGSGMELGGDFYDVWALPDGRYAFAIGDAAGSGPEAAASSTMVRFSLRGLTSAGMSPADALRTLNETMLDAATGDDVVGERFCTAVLGVVTPGERPGVVLASGGHPLPILRRAAAPAEELELRGSLLGVVDQPDVAEVAIELGPGDVLVLVTDGATEARRDGEMLGAEGVRRAVDAAGPLATDVAAAVDAAVVTHTAGALRDDLATLVLRTT